MESTDNIYATCLEIKGQGLLLLGPSGAGKSDLALRLIQAGAGLVSDDRTDLFVIEGCLYAAPPPVLEGLIEARSVGLLRVPFVRRAPVSFCVELVKNPQELERMPKPMTRDFCGVNLPLYRLYGLGASAPALVQLLAAGNAPLQENF